MRRLGSEDTDFAGGEKCDVAQVMKAGNTVQYEGMFFRMRNPLDTRIWKPCTRLCTHKKKLKGAASLQETCI